MCGIVGYSGFRQASSVLIAGLKRLEYRGYDSSGISVLNTQGLVTFKKTGKIINLQQIVPKDLQGLSGIGHTRWATHGGVTDRNAHPHNDGKNSISIVHNGIIENYISLKEMLKADGVVFKSETDSEVLAHLVAKFYEDDLEKAVKKALTLVKGTYGIICMHRDKPGILVGARNGSPLVLGIGEKEMFLASDVSAVIGYTKQGIYLVDREVIIVDENNYRSTDLGYQELDKKVEHISWELEELEKGGYPHFMLKEIFEQVDSIPRAYSGRIDEDLATAKLGGLNMTNRELLDVERIKIIAAGTSFHAGWVACYLMESMARIPCSIELASELRYRNPIVEKNTLYLALSQSGETADTLYALREIQRKGGRVLGICNVVGSTIARESDGGVYIHSGPEIAVASTKAFTSQITALYLFTLLLARMRSLSWEEGTTFINNLKKLPEMMQSLLETKDQIAALAKKYAHYQDFLFLGRGINYPGALEGALKLKEISYIHAEGFSAAEIKHGPIALINEETPSFFLVPDDGLKSKVISNMKEIKARKGLVIALAVEGDEEVAEIADDVLYVPRTHDFFYPFLMALPQQLFAYYCALELERDVDQPRNLAKSVTVE
ncbi:MAG: glutamine--fructose-6-phosphate transaminase (isomerizing) [Spirochaetaceae bacterium]|jgi:glucosamine--fructose-6-phosphate aminotransferase (isomerizing)|nr:glutamine--fructose-6-phosphate transaminase (isomerizing) [Spirochaetaceae bacterium]